MKTRLIMFVACILSVATVMSYGQMIKRTDAIWARTTTSAITLDGKLNEAAWAAAESLTVRFNADNGMPGSGKVQENGIVPTDPTNATVKFLVKGDSLYVGVVAWDKSVGGGLFNRFDGLLMNIRRREQTNRPTNAFEYFYAWWTEADTTLDEVGKLPGFFGAAGSAYQDPRADSLKNVWDAVTTVQGISNDDASDDTSWTTELKFNLTERGYNVSQAGGDIVMFNISVYDADYQWPLDTLKQSGNRTWVQNPWGNTQWYNHLRVHVDPMVTTTSGAVPTIPAELIIPSGENYATPTIDGRLTEDVWRFAPYVDIKFGDAAIRDGYPATGPYRSGQFQPTVNGGQAVVADPSLARVKYFYKGDTLYLGFDVQDIAVQSVEQFDRWDGFRVTMNQRNERNSDSSLITRGLAFRVDSMGNASRENDLSVSGWDSTGSAVAVALALKGGTTVDTTGLLPDSGYTAEMRVNLSRFGYPAGRGDGVAFLGIMMLDGDSFTPATNSYGTRTWYMRETTQNDGPVWAYMDPAAVITAVDETNAGVPDRFALIGNYPNPFNPSTTIKFVLPQTSDVTLEVFDVLGRRVATQLLGVQQPGEHSVQFNAARLASGMYNYRLTMATTNASVVGKMMLLK
jgi:Secretion system C-terminal sorting domain